MCYTIFSTLKTVIRLIKRLKLPDTNRGNLIKYPVSKTSTHRALCTATEILEKDFRRISRLTSLLAREREESMLTALTNFVSIKVLAIILILLAVGFSGYVYFQANSANLAWCAANVNACRIARIQALEKDYSSLNPRK